MDERTILDQFCTRDARLCINRIDPSGVSGALMPIIQALIEKSYLAETPKAKATFHLTELGVKYCGGYGQLPHVRRGN